MPNKCVESLCDTASIGLETTTSCKSGIPIHNQKHREAIPRPIDFLKLISTWMGSSALLYIHIERERERERAREREREREREVSTYISPRIQLELGANAKENKQKPPLRSSSILCIRHLSTSNPIIRSAPTQSYAATGYPSSRASGAPDGLPSRPDDFTPQSSQRQQQPRRPGAGPRCPNHPLRRYQ